MERVEEIVSRYFKVENVFHLEDGFEFEVYSENYKDSFRKLYSDVTKEGYVPKLIKRGSKVLLSVTRLKEEKTKPNYISIVLLLASLGTIILDGYYKIGYYNQYLLAYEAPVLALLVIHEGVRRLVSFLKRTKPTTTYAIPGYPGIIPFMGFITTRTNSPINLDDLFDETFYPLAAALAGTLAFLLISPKVNLTFPKPINLPFFYQIFSSYINRNNAIFEGLALSVTILFINFLPGTNLDGGVLISGVKGNSFVFDLISIIIMSFLGYFILALMIIILQNMAYRVEVLDSVSPLSRDRRIIYYCAFAVVTLLFLLLGTF